MGSVSSSCRFAPAVCVNTQQLRARARGLTRQYMAGGAGSFDDFRELVQLLLSVTVLADNQFDTLRQGQDQARRGTWWPRSSISPIRIRDSRWLRSVTILHLAPHDDGSSRLKLEQTSLVLQILAHETGPT